MESVKNVKNKSIAINALLNTIRQTFAILFPLITLPYASRVLEVENYGKINFAVSYVSYFSIIAALGIATYAVREGAALRNNRNLISSFASQMFTINILATLISYILLFSSAIFFQKTQQNFLLIVIYAFNIMLTTLGVEWIYSIYEDFLFITIRTIFIQVISLVLMFLFVDTKDDFYIYAVINVIANGGANIFSFLHARKYVDLKLLFCGKLKKHLKPLVLLLGNTIAMVIYVNSDITFLGFLADDESVGIYSVAVKIYTGVKQILLALLVVAIPRINIYLSVKNKSQYNQFLSNVFMMLLVVVLPVMAGVFILSKELILIVAGDGYQGGYEALRILAVSLMFSIGANFYSFAVLIANNREYDVLKSTIIAAIANASLNFIFIAKWKETGAAATTLIAELIVFFICFWYAKDYCNINLKFCDVASVIVGTMGMICSCIIICDIVSESLFRLLISFILSLIVYLVILEKFNNTGFNILLGKIKMCRK